MRKNKGEMIDSKYFRFKFLEGDYQINIFFDKVTYDIIGWQNVDIYQNLVITYLFNLQKNVNIEGLFSLRSLCYETVAAEISGVLQLDHTYKVTF